jgi:hypothetical protein
MPNWSYTDVTITGPDADIERFKQACFFLEPKEDASGIDFERIIPSPKNSDSSPKDFDLPSAAALNDWGRENWGTKWLPRVSTYHVDEQGHLQLCLITAWSPPDKVLEKIVAMFPELTLDVRSTDEMGNYFIKGTISKNGTALHDDEEAMQEHIAFMKAASEQYDKENALIEAEQARNGAVKVEEPHQGGEQ